MLDAQGGPGGFASSMMMPRQESDCLPSLQLSVKTKKYKQDYSWPGKSRAMRTSPGRFRLQTPLKTRNILTPESFTGPGVLSRASAEACHRNRMANHSWTRARMSIIRKAFSGLVSACDGSRRLRVTGARLRAMWLRGLAASTLQLMREAAQTGRGLASVRRAIAKGR
jgi:hypothetical protein